MQLKDLKSLKDLENPEVLRDLVETGKQQVQAFPVLSVAVAAGLGFVLGVSGIDRAYSKVHQYVKPQLRDFDAKGFLMNALNGTLFKYGGGREQELPSKSIS